MSPACMNSLTQKSISSLLDDDDGEALSASKDSAASIPEPELLSTAIARVSDQKLSSIWNSCESEAELPVFSNDEAMQSLSVEDDVDRDCSGETGTEETGPCCCCWSVVFTEATCFLALRLAGAPVAVPCVFPSSLFLMCVCQTFLISLSVLPGSLAAIADHLNHKNKNCFISVLKL